MVLAHLRCEWLLTSQGRGCRPNLQLCCMSGVTKATATQNRFLIHYLPISRAYRQRAFLGVLRPCCSARKSLRSSIMKYHWWEGAPDASSSYSSKDPSRADKVSKPSLSYSGVVSSIST